VRTGGLPHCRIDRDLPHCKLSLDVAGRRGQHRATSRIAKGDHRRRYGLRAWIFIIAGFALGGAPTDVSATDQPAGPQPVQRLLDLSGLAWLGGDTFLTVHDAKYPDEGTRVRVSLLVLPNSLECILESDRFMQA
jgi:hypothetical protein